MNRLKNLVDAAEHALAVFRSLGERGHYPQELLPDDGTGTPSDLFMGKQGLMFLINPIKEARAVLDNDWSAWTGGECPVAPDVSVEYQMLNDESTDIARSGSLIWDHDEGTIAAAAQIVAYRVVSVPEPEKPKVIQAWVSTMQTSAGTDYYVCVGVRTDNPFARTYMTPQKYRIKGRAEYVVACWNHMLGHCEEPDIMAYNTDSNDEPDLD